VRRALNRRDHPFRRQKQANDNENGDHGPGPFHLRTPVDLCGLTAVIAVFFSEFRDYVGEQGNHDYEYHRDVQQDENRQSEDRFRGSGYRGNKFVGLIVMISYFLGTYLVPGLWRLPGKCQRVGTYFEMRCPYSLRSRHSRINGVRRGRPEDTQTPLSVE
jgi:hypothetical protein